MYIFDKSFIKQPKNYIVQSVLAIVAVAAILFFMDTLTHVAIVAALGSSAFIVFAMPHSITAQPRRLIGGQIIGILCGTLCFFLFIDGPLGGLLSAWEHTRWFIYALPVGLSIFLMTITNTEHPPAASTALGIVAHEWSVQVVVFVIVYAVLLAIARRLLKGYLRDLY